MTDGEIERMILDVIKHRGITWDDMVGGPSLRFDQGAKVIFRENAFKSNVWSWSQRFIELLTPVPGDPMEESHDLPSLTDLFRYWWNTCASQEDMIDEVLEDLFSHFKDMLTPPPKKESKPKPLIVDFREIVSEGAVDEVLNLPRTAIGECDQQG